jgi:predicted HTH transcriptional regulator
MTITQATLRDIAAARPQQSERKDGFTSQEYHAYLTRTGRSVSQSTAHRDIEKLLQQGVIRYDGKVQRPNRMGEMKPRPFYTLTKAGK